MNNAWRSLAAVCLLVIGMYAYTAPLGRLEASSLNAADTSYNLLVQGFRAGQLNLKKEVPPRFARLADPYDPAANGLYQNFAYRLRDLSYYQGRFYIYFGVTPALILFWPFVALTGHYLFDRQAVTIFCAIGLLASLGLLRALWRRYFPEVSVWVVAACALALGLVSGLPMMLPRSEIHEVAESCGYMLAMLSLGAIWCALHESDRRAQWLAASSAAYGLAVGARPSLLFGAVILLVPVAQAWPEWRRVGRLLVAATVPITLIGLGLMLYNTRRFDNPFEFGWRYQLASKRQLEMQFLSLRYLWFNFRVYFLEPARWSSRFPFVRDIAVPPLPKGYYLVDSTFGILADTPLVWVALAAPLAWRRRSSQEAMVLRLFVATTALFFGVCALTVGLFCAASPRYAVDFLPALVLLAVVGILGLERVLAPTSESGQACRRAWRRAVRWGWGVLLGFSVAFSVLVSVVNYAHTACGLGTVLLLTGRVPEAIQVFEKALRIEPDFADGHYNLGNAFMQTGKAQEAIQEYERALRLKPDYADAHVNLGTALAKLGRSEDATRHFEEAVRIEPDNPVAHHNIGY
ncbi:MAG: tetratricopeptide repeat protein, partial [Verrucomicrobiia bacterium]